ncbi:MAG: LLM class flavin-dependent oxidoreductase [Christensenellaceae bacterium]|jgi:probable F420-dependent oxidoreductase|nr:LLM class flavin-dependent oxidoreductase [Christensenellaceae bacterium]
MSKKIRFGVGIPTGEEGLMYPIPFASAQDNVRIAQAAEKMGYDSVWGNDHVLTQRYVKEEFGTAPRYYAPLITLAAVAQATSTIKVCTALLVAPFRHPVIVAKEVATLDHLSGGRVLLATGIGAYLEEFQNTFGSKVEGFKRGEMLDEMLEALTLLWGGKSCSYGGKYYEFNDVECYPPPVQTPLPVYIGGNSDVGRRRVARHGNGWLPAALPVEQVRSGLDEIYAIAERTGRDMSGLDVAPQFFVYVANTQEEAEAGYRESQMYKHQLSLKNTTLKNQQLDYRDISLVGSPEYIKERIGRYVEAGVTTFAAMLFSTKTVDHTLDMMQYFSETVMPEFVK